MHVFVYVLTEIMLLTMEKNCVKDKEMKLKLKVILLSCHVKQLIMVTLASNY